MSTQRLNSLKTMALVSVTAAATSLLIQACGGGGAGGGSSGLAFAQTAAEAADPLEGTWSSSVTVKDCTSGATLTQFNGFSLFHRGGTLSADNTTPVPSRGAAFGIWRRNGTGAYAANMVFIKFNADGTVSGTQKVERTLALAADGNNLTGTLKLQFFAPNGELQQQGCASETALRVTWAAGASGLN